MVNKMVEQNLTKLKLIKDLHEEVINSKDETINALKNQIQLMESKQETREETLNTAKQAITEIKESRQQQKPSPTQNKQEIQEPTKNSNVLNCPYCGKKLSVRGLGSHVKIVHNTKLLELLKEEDGLYHCQSCNFTAKKLKTLRSHARDHDRNPTQMAASVETSQEQQTSNLESTNPNNFMTEELREKLENYLSQQKTAVTQKTIMKDLFGEEKENTTETKGYKRVYEALSSDTNIKQARLGRLNSYYINEQQYRNKKRQKAKQKIVDKIGKNEYQHRRLALNKLLPDQDKETEKSFQDFSKIYSPNQQTTSRKAWKMLCTNTDFHNAVKYDLEIEFTIKLLKKKQSKDPLQQYILQIKRGGEKQ